MWALINSHADEAHSGLISPPSSVEAVALHSRLRGGNLHCSESSGQLLAIPSQGHEQTRAGVFERSRVCV